jgi:hypothetical protein
MNPASNPPPSRHSAWSIPTNPIFRRYCRSRLRPRGLVVSVLITVLIAGFLFAITRSLGIHRVGLSEVDAERGPLIPLLVLQGVILFVLGTAQVAGGMVADRDEGVIDYQRLIPMSPLAKVFGYLFGLPIREYVMVAATLPFTVWALWRGEVSAGTWVPLYGVLFSSTLLYHFTGLVTGTVVKNRRWAFLASVGLVFCLYTVVPQMSRFGLVFFKYLTITPVFQESLPGLLQQSAGELLAAGQRLVPTVKFFNLDFSEAVFTIFSQGGLVLTFTVMLCRQWRRGESHLLGKSWATGFFIWIQVLLLGNALPLVDQGKLFPSRAMAGFFSDWKPDGLEAVAMSGLYGMVTLALLVTLAGIITPNPDRQLRGWRRARKQGGSAPSRFSDAASGFGFVLIMAVAGAAGWYLFTRGLIESRWFPGHHVPVGVFGIFTAVMVAAGLGFQVLMESRGGRSVGMAAIFIGVVPLMVGAVLAASSDRLIPAAAWLIGISPLSFPLYAAAGLLSVSELPESLSRAVPAAFHSWLVVAMLSTGWLGIRLRAARNATAARALAGPAAPGP